MPRIKDEFLDCVVYLYPSEADAEDGARAGGSGFLLGVPLIDVMGEEPPPGLLCVVTNKHVVNNGSMVLRLNTMAGDKAVLPLDHAKWFLHPNGDDLALCYIGLRQDYYKYRCVTIRDFVRKDTIEFFGFGPGDDVFVVGRFVNHEGKQRNNPTVRFGNIAQMPLEPIRMDDGFMQESFLVEARSIAGYSGSPVFVYIPAQPPFPVIPGRPDLTEKLPGYDPRRSFLNTMVGPFLLGVDHCHLHSYEKVRHLKTGEPVDKDWYVKSNTGMMGVIPAWKLMELVESTPLGEIRRKANEELRARQKQSGATRDVASPAESEPPTTDENPRHKEDFTSLLAAAAKKRPQGE